MSGEDRADQTVWRVTAADLDLLARRTLSEDENLRDQAWLYVDVEEPEWLEPGFYVTDGIEETQWGPFESVDDAEAFVDSDKHLQSVGLVNQETSS